MKSRLAKKTTQAPDLEHPPGFGTALTGLRIAYSVLLELKRWKDPHDKDCACPLCYALDWDVNGLLWAVNIGVDFFEASRAALDTPDEETWPDGWKDRIKAALASAKPRKRAKRIAAVAAGIRP
ncbi:MAG: hypothetical protein K2R98_02655 [Gemmataceae bacterium]|nr:hypothetical protein [Gemmataceae bacterium]